MSLLKSPSLPIGLLFTVFVVTWLKRIQSHMFWTCTDVLNALGSANPTSDRCMTSAHRLLQTVNILQGLALLLLIAILVRKTWPWWIKLAASIIWIWSVIATFSVD